MLRLLIIAFVILVFSFEGKAQDRKIDQLEILFDQGHYRRTLRKANRLLDKPDYDYSSVPKLFKSLSLFKLTQDDHYRKKNPEAFDEAVRNFEIFIHQDVNGYAYSAHRDKILEVQVNLAQRSLKLKNKGQTAEAKAIEEIINKLFKDKKTLEELAMLPFINKEVDDAKEEFIKPEKGKDKEKEKDKDEKIISKSGSRDEIIDYAKKYLGVKYKYGGTDKKGFDCSGYTGFVMKEFDIFLPRTSGDQYQTVKKIKKNKVKKGDLVFFGGRNINHVGIICSEPGEQLHMIHASTSIGISIVNIEQSSYWKPRIKGYGRVIND